MLRRTADDQFSVDVETPAAAQAVAVALRQGAEWLEVVPGIDTVVVQFDAATCNAEDVERQLAELLAGDTPELQQDAEVIEIPVLYGGAAGPDLEAVCARLGLSEDDFIALHTGKEYGVEMLGFTPGFAFIGGLDERLQVARRDAPRAMVAAGSIGIADSRTGLYALASPGGWQLVGRTPESWFDVTAAEPATLSAGKRIRFRAIDQDEFDTWD